MGRFIPWIPVASMTDAPPACAPSGVRGKTVRPLFTAWFSMSYQLPIRPSHPVRRLRHAPVAAVARVPSQAVPAAAGRALAAAGDLAAPARPAGRRGAAGGGQRGAPLHGRRAVAPGRRDALGADPASRSAATPRRRSRSPRCRRHGRRRRSGAAGAALRPRDRRRGRLPRRRAGRAAGRRRPASWSPSASCRPRPKPATATSMRRPATAVRDGACASSRSPTQATAERYVASGDYFWNSGMFAFRASRYLEELAAHPAAHGRAGARVARQGHAATPISCAWTRTAFAACPSDSIDYAVMENTDRRRGRCRSTSAGTTSARGRRCGRWSSRTATATPIAAT